MKGMLVVVMLLLHLAGAATSSNGENERVKMPENRSLFKVQLGTPASGLLAEIERKYGKTVRAEESPGLNGIGECSVEDDGTPVIRINPTTGRTESTIVHELFHLKLKLEGYPIFAWRFPEGQGTPENVEYIKWIRGHLYDGICHWIFYKRMKEMGVDTNSQEKEQFIKSIKQDKFDGTNAATEREALILYYVKAKLEIDEPELLLAIEEWYKSKGWIEQLKIGESLAQLIISSNPRTPEDSIETFLKCINKLLMQHATFEVENWGSRPRGSVAERYVVFNVLPPNLH